MVQLPSLLKNLKEGRKKVVLGDKSAENLWIRINVMFSIMMKNDQMQEILRVSGKVRRFLLYFPP